MNKKEKPATEKFLKLVTVRISRKEINNLVKRTDLMKKYLPYYGEK